MAGKKPFGGKKAAPFTSSGRKQSSPRTFEGLKRKGKKG